MKIKFIDSNNNTKNIEQLKNLKKLDDIYLSSQNPRYTTLKSLDENLIDLIKNVKKTQDEIKKELLGYESDFSHLKNLLQSILDIGFDTEIEPILLIWNDKIKKYIVAEGNRRTMCLKLITNELHLDDLEKLLHIDNLDITDSDEDDDNENYIERRKNNYSFIANVIKAINDKYGEETTFDVHVKIVENNTELWRLIYTKHIAGKRPGMRRWNRGKYFTDILSLFKNGIKTNDEIFKRIRTLLQREPNVILDDFKHAQFVKEIIKRAKIYPVKFKDISDDMIFEQMKSIKISALQSNFSLKRVKVAAKEILGIDSKVFGEKFLKISFNDLNILNYDVETKKEDIFELIYSNYEKGVITTRPIKPEHKYNFNLDVKKMLTVGAINTKNKIDSDKLEKMESFDFSTKQLDEIIEVGEENNISPIILERYKATKEIKENDNKLKEINEKTWKNELNSTRPQDIFAKLSDQYFHNSKNEKVFLNAMASTIRSMLEQIIVWSAYYVDDVVGSIVVGNHKIEIKRETYAKWLAETKIHKIFLKIRENYFNTVDLKKMINSISKVKMEEEPKFIFKKKNEINTLLNEFIHASHRIYIKSKFNDNLRKYSKWQKNIMGIISNINIEKIIDLSNEISSKLK